jgi:hypothetical protein
MGTSARVIFDIEVKPRTPRKIKDIIYDAITDVVGCHDFVGRHLNHDFVFGFSYTGLNILESLKLPVEVNKWLVKADMSIVYLEQAPREEFDLIGEEEEE